MGLRGERGGASGEREGGVSEGNEERAREGRGGSRGDRV